MYTLKFSPKAHHQEDIESIFHKGKPTFIGS